MRSPIPSSPVRLVFTTLVAACALAGCRAAGDPDADAADRARAALGDDVRGTVRVPGSGMIAALAEETVGRGRETRWLVLLGANGRERARVHTYLPVEDAPGRFGTVDADGDGKPEVFAVGSAWSLAATRWRWWPSRRPARRRGTR
jgi:hypothetical protein